MFRFFACVTLLAFLPGCSGLHEVPWTTNPAAEPLPGEVGRRARVTLDDGTRHEGEVVRVDDAEIVLGKIGNFGKTESVFPRERIVQVEVEKDTWWESTLGYTALALVVAAAVYAAAMSDALEGLGD